MQGRVDMSDDEMLQNATVSGALVEGLPEAVVLVGADGRIALVNARAEQLFDCRRSDLLGRHYGVLLPARSRQDVAGMRAGAVASDGPDRVGSEFGLRARRRDGTEFPVEATFAAFDAGAGSGFVVCVRDVSERVRVDAELREALSLLGATLESTADGILVVAADGRIAGSNGRFAVLWGIPAGLIESGEDDRVMAFVLGQLADPESFVAKVRELYADPGAESLDLLEFRDGRRYERYSRPQRLGEEIVGRVWSFRDVTARYRAQEQARQAAAELEGLAAIVNSSADAIIGLTPDGVITSWNPGAEQLYGYVAGEMLGRETSILIPEHLKQAEAIALAAVRGSGLVQSFETERLRRDGTLVPVALTVSPILGENGVRGIAKIGRDITGRKAAEAELSAAREEALHSSRLKSEFLATMSHEIRTPMNGVIGLTGLLLDTELDETQRRYAEGIKGAGEALLTLINDVLDFSKLEAGRIELESASFDPRLLVEEVAVMLAEQAATKRLELIAYCRPEVPDLLVGDAGRVRQILLNLFSNAVKFTDTGDVTLKVSVVDDSGVAALSFEVRDTGIGIAAADHLRVFESFSQADASTTRRFGGTGLGLAISRRLAEEMGGRIGLSSVPGQGSTFWVVLPLVEVARPHEVPAEPQQGVLSGLRVLVVDDNATNRLVLESQLVSWRMLPDTVPDSAQAVTRCLSAAKEGRPYDFAVLDMCMPGMNGLELARRISAEPSLRDTRLILLTSTAQIDREALTAAGVREWLSKPVRSSELYDRLMRLVAPQATSVSQTVHVPAAYDGPSRGLVLVVEDNDVNQLVARAMVTRLGYAVHMVADGAQALAATASTTYVAVLMDCHMPVMDGFAATRAIREREGPGARVPIIAMTAGALDEDRERCLASDMDDYLAKPVDPAALDEVLMRWVGASVPVPESGAAVRVGSSDAVDAGRLAVLRGLGPADGAGVLPAAADAFRRAVPEHLAALGRAVTDADDEALHLIAHQLKGAAANIGANGVAALCAELESPRHPTGIPDFRQLLTRLEAELVRVDEVLGSAVAEVS